MACTSVCFVLYCSIVQCLVQEYIESVLYSILYALGLVTRGGMSPTAAVLRWRAVGYIVCIVFCTVS